MTDDLTARITAALDQREHDIEGSGTLGWLTFRQPNGTIAYTAAAHLAGDTWIVNGKEAIGYDKAEVIYDERHERDLIAAHREILAWCQRANELLPGAGGFKVLQMLAKAHRIEVPE